MQGFYFRHDSIKNPPFDKNLINYDYKIGWFSKEYKKDLVNNENILNIFLDKVKS